MIHELKTWPGFYRHVARKIKSFEVRRHDRDFKEGDTLILKEYFRDTKTYSGASLKVKIDYVLEGGQFGIEHGYCVIGFDPNNITTMS